MVPAGAFALDRALCFRAAGRVDGARARPILSVRRLTTEEDTMATKVKAIPKGYHTITPNLSVRDAARAIDFYRKAFGAEELVRMPGPDGKIMHAELKIGDSIMMLAEEKP